MTGYGYATYLGKPISAHRLIYYLKTGILSTRKYPLDHLCRNRKCVNPDHLEIVTPSQNVMRGLIGKGEAESWNGSKTHCPHGHEYTDENTGRYGTQGRKCLTCKRIRDKEYVRKNSKKIAQYKKEYYEKNKAKKLW